jgi:hypothetical protein
MEWIYMILALLLAVGSLAAFLGSAMVEYNREPWYMAGSLMLVVLAILAMVLAANERPPICECPCETTTQQKGE